MAFEGEGLFHRIGNHHQMTLRTARGHGLNGLAQPLVITLVLRGAGSGNQGKAVGLRGTANRTASILAPLAMGAIAEMVGLETAFYITGVALSLIMAALAVFLYLRRDVAAAGED
jgi:MFS family permease